MKHKDYYQTLGVARTASADDIKKAYRKLVRKHHPDVSRAKDADQKTKEINEAYAVLGDPDKRAEYDAPAAARHGQGPFGRASDWNSEGFGRHGAAHSYGAAFDARHGGPGFDPDDFFADLFTSGAGRAGGTSGRSARRGADVHATLSVSLHELYHGATRAVTFLLPGHGGERQLSVTVPKGTLPGQQLRMAGQGQADARGGKPGDLLLEITLHPDPRYRVEGRNVTATLPIAPWEAALGADIEVPTPSGQVRVKIPPGSQAGRKLRLKGRGLPSNPPGDLYLELSIVVPPANTPQARALYEAMARELAFNPRAQARA